MKCPDNLTCIISRLHDHCSDLCPAVSLSPEQTRSLPLLPSLLRIIGTSNKRKRKSNLDTSFQTPALFQNMDGP